MTPRARKPTRLELVERSLTDAEAGLARAIDLENPTAEANIISRLHTIRTAYADLLEETEDEPDSLTPAEAAETIIELLTLLDEDGRRAVSAALTQRRP